MRDTQERKKVVQRSPGYPMISLEEAIQRIHVLWEKDKTNAIPEEVVYEHLGYKHFGGYGARILAALKKFDLISEENNDIKLTENSIDIMLHDSTSEEFKNIVRKIALKPTVYGILYNEYGNSLPSDETLKSKLIKEFKFNASKVEDFINVFKKTLDYAGLASKELKQQEKLNEIEHGGTLEKPLEIHKDIKSGNVLLSFDIPLNDNFVTLSFNKLPVDPEDLEDIKKWIELFGKRLIKREKQEGSSA